MMKKILTGLYLAFVIILCSITSVKAQTDTTFTPYGEPIVLFYSDIKSTYNKEGNSKAFELTRVYLGYEYFFSKHLSARANTDIADGGTGGLKTTLIMKYAYLLYNNNYFSTRLGMIAVDQYMIQEKQWGYRYIYKSFQDAYGYGPSADLGVGFEFFPSKHIKFDLSILNGEGYKKVQADSIFKTTFGLTVKPFKGFVLRAHCDMMKKFYSQTSYSFYAGYSYRHFKAGAEYNIQKNHDMIHENGLSGVSLYTSLMIGSKFSIFTRYDNLHSEIPSGESDPWNVKKDGQLFLAGFDYSPVDNIKFAPVFLGWAPSDKSKYFTSTIVLNAEIEF